VRKGERAKKAGGGVGGWVGVGGGQEAGRGGTKSRCVCVCVCVCVNFGAGCACARARTHTPRRERRGMRVFILQGSEEYWGQVPYGATRRAPKGRPTAT
jgi:hypothetical protein